MEYYNVIFFVASILNPLFLVAWLFTQDDVESKNKQEDLNNFLSIEDLSSNPPGKKKKTHIQEMKYNNFICLFS